MKGTADFTTNSIEGLRICSNDDERLDCHLDFEDDCNGDGIRLTESGAQCVFPMIKDGVEYRDCIQHESIEKVELCAVEVDPCSCTLNGRSGNVETGRKGCVGTDSGESVDLICLDEHNVEGTESWCYVTDPVSCKMQSEQEREFKKLGKVTFYDGVSFLGAGWRYCELDEESLENNFKGDLSICEMCVPRGERGGRGGGEEDNFLVGASAEQAFGWLLVVSVIAICCVAACCGTVVHRKHHKLAQVQIRHGTVVRRMTGELQTMREGGGGGFGNGVELLNIASITRRQQLQPVQPVHQMVQPQPYQNLVATRVNDVVQNAGVGAYQNSDNKDNEIRQLKEELRQLKNMMKGENGGGSGFGDFSNFVLEHGENTGNPKTGDEEDENEFQLAHANDNEKEVFL